MFQSQVSFFKASKTAADKLYHASMAKKSGEQIKEKDVKRKSKANKQLTVDQIKRNEKVLRQKVQLKQMKEVVEMSKYSNARPPNFSTDILSQKVKVPSHDEGCCKVRKYIIALVQISFVHRSNCVFFYKYNRYIIQARTVNKSDIYLVLYMHGVLWTTWNFYLS